MDLQAVLLRDEFRNLSDAAALAHGNENLIVGGSDEHWSYSGVANHFGDAAAEGLLAAIQAAGLPGAAQVYLTIGFQLSHPSVQDKLTTIGLAVPQLSTLCHALKEIGITHGTRWQLLGVDQPTLQNITDARAAIANELALQNFSALCQSVVNQWRNGQIVSLSQAKAAINAG